MTQSCECLKTKFSIFFIIADLKSASIEVKVAKRVSFDESSQAGANSCYNANGMDAQQDEGMKPSFLMGGEDDVEDTDEFPVGNSSQLGLVKQLSDAALMDKRRRLR